MTDTPERVAAQYLDSADNDMMAALLLIAWQLLLLENDLERCKAMVSRGHVRAAPVETPRSLKPEPPAIVLPGKEQP